MCVVGSGSRRWSRGSSRIRIRAMPPPSESHYLLTGVIKGGPTTPPADFETEALARAGVRRLGGQHHPQRPRTSLFHKGLLPRRGGCRRWPTLTGGDVTPLPRWIAGGGPV